MSGRSCFSTVGPWVLVVVLTIVLPGCNRSRADANVAQLEARLALRADKPFDAERVPEVASAKASSELAQARNSELAAMLDYVRSLTDFEALQQASLDSSGNTVTVSGSTVRATAAQAR